MEERKREKLERLKIISDDSHFKPYASPFPNIPLVLAS